MKYRIFKNNKEKFLIQEGKTFNWFFTDWENCYISYSDQEKYHLKADCLFNSLESAEAYIKDKEEEKALKKFKLVKELNFDS